MANYSPSASREFGETYGSVDRDEGRARLIRSACLPRALYHIRRNYKILIFGQLLSLLLASSGAFQATLHLNCGLSAPTFTISVVYLVLAFHLLVVWKRGSLRPLRQEEEEQEQVGSIDDAEETRFEDAEQKNNAIVTEDSSEIFYPFMGLLLHRPAWQYMIIALFDVEANYFTVLAFRYTTLTSVTLFDALAIPSSMIISRCFLGRQYTSLHLFGAVTCMIGIVLNVMQDYESDQATDSQAYPHKLRGDILAIVGGILYGLNDVLCESNVRHHRGTAEYLGMVGLFAFLISAIQASAVERQDILQFFHRNPEKTSQCSLAMGWSMFSLFVGVNACSYMGASRFLLISEAAFFNLSLLTGDMWSVLFSVVAEHIIPKPLFFVALMFVLSGVIVYEMAPTPVLEDRGDDSESATQTWSDVCYDDSQLEMQEN